MTDFHNQQRTYRNRVCSSKLIRYIISEYETDLHISTETNLATRALKSIKVFRKQLTDFIKTTPEFETSFSPIEVPDSAPAIIKAMSAAAWKANVGPFAAVAGAMAEFVGKDLMQYSDEVIIENGGDIFISCNTDITAGLFAGKSVFSEKFGIKIPASLMPAGICSSSGTIGHSKSFGRADCVSIISRSTPLADAVATAAANLIQSEEDINKAIDFAFSIEGVLGIIAIINDQIGARGDFELVKII